MKPRIPPCLPTAHTPLAHRPVGLPDVQSVRIRDPPLLSLLLQEVKEVLDSQWGLVFTDAQDGLEQVIQKLLQCALQRSGVAAVSPGPLGEGEWAPLLALGSPKCLGWRPGKPCTIELVT